MTRFFKSFRRKLLGQKKVSKYLLYAIGEILLVVIGILLAIQINKWNENHKKKQLVRTYAIALINDFKADIEEINAIRKQMEESVIRIDSLSNYIRSKKIDEISNLILLPFCSGDYVYRPYRWNKGTIEELKQSGVLRFKGNEDLANKMVNYEALRDHMDEDYISDMKIHSNISNQSDRIVNLNYSNYGELAFYGNTNNSILEHNFMNSDEYLEAKRQNLKLLTDDLNLIHELVNSSIKLRFFLLTRYEKELPRLIKNGEKIITLLETSYLD